MLKRIVLVILSVVICQLSIITPAFAASAYPLNTNPDVPQNFHTYTQSVFIEIAAAISCQLTGYDPTNPGGKCLGIDPKTRKIGYVEGGGGAIGMVGSFIASTFYIPISTHDYGVYMAQNFGLSKKSYAQSPSPVSSGDVPYDAGQSNKSYVESSLGYNALLPTLNLWRTFRNLTYLLFVILFIVIGLGIMFRIKIDPRTVMSIQNQIPKIIIGIVFVTLSYAIAGFLIDLMYVSIYVIMSLFAQSGSGVDPSKVLSTNPFSAAGGIGGISGISFGVAKTISGVVASIFDGTLGKIMGAIIGGVIGKFIGNAAGGPVASMGIPFVGQIASNLIGTAVGGVAGFLFADKIIGVVAGLIAYIVIIIALFSALLRLWFALIKAYIFVFITVVFAPLYIAYGLIPGKSGVGNWFKSMLANLAVFPATITMFLLGQAFTHAFSQGATDNLTARPFAPPLVGNFLQPSQFASIIGLGIILMTPEVVNMVRDTLKAPEFKYSTSIGRSIGVGTGVISAGPRQAWSSLMRQPRWLGDTGGPLFQTLSNIQGDPNRKWAGRILSWVGFHGHSASSHS